MRTPINIDLSKKNEPIPAGRLGEHNAQKLIISVPQELSGSTYRVMFDIGTGVAPSSDFHTTPIEVTLWQQVTSREVVPFWVEAYEGDTYLGKTSSATLTFELPSSGAVVPIDGDAQSLSMEVAQNTLARHTHANKELLDAYDGTSTGGGILTVDTVADLPDDASDGTIAMVRFVDRTGTLTPPEAVVNGSDDYRRPVEGQLYVSKNISCDMQMVGTTIFLQAGAAGNEDLGVFDSKLLKVRDKYAIVLQELVPGTNLFGVFVLDPNNDFEMMFLYPCQYTDLEGIVLKSSTWYRYDNEEFVEIAVPMFNGLFIVVAYDSENNRIAGQTQYDQMSKVVSPRPYNNVLHVIQNGIWTEVY